MVEAPEGATAAVKVPCTLQHGGLGLRSDLKGAAGLAEGAWGLRLQRVGQMAFTSRLNF